MKKTSDSKRYSIITDDLEHCIECGRTNINKHEIFYGEKNRELSKKYGLVIPLCEAYHHNQYQSKGIHFDAELCKKWHIKGQEAFMEHYNKTADEFRQIFGKNYI